MRVLNIEHGHLTVDEARRKLLADLALMQKTGGRLLKIIHGWGSSGAGGKLGPALRKSLRLRRKEGMVTLIVPGERFSSDTIEGRELAAAYPHVRNDPDWNRANPGITVVLLASQSATDAPQPRRPHSRAQVVSERTSVPNRVQLR